MSTVGFIHSGSPNSFTVVFDAFAKALPNSVGLKHLWALDDGGDLKDFAKELVEDRNLGVIVAAGGPGPALLLKDLTKRLRPDLGVVFTTVVDPVASKLVDHLDHPGHNLTGMAGQTSELDPERLKKLFELTPDKISPGDEIGVLLLDNRDRGDEQYQKLEEMARDLDLRLRPKKVSTVDGIQRAFDFFEQQRVKGVVVTADSFFNNHRQEVVDIAQKTNLPAVYQWKEFVDQGGYMSHAPDILEAYLKAAEFATRILNGEKPARMACSTPSRPRTYVNMRTAQQLGIKVPEKLNGEPIERI